MTLQVAASAVGGAAVPAGLGLVIGAGGADRLAPLLAGPGLAMCGLGWPLRNARLAGVP